ncbi:MAG TPA: crotonase/enoyl-CoA hydratase family protein [Solirubrobacterales bacterium]|nr:crotonase/enoyl-CoA hydratase family protein [Solirubrobacterales bacterium]
MTDEPVLFQKEGGVGTITLNRAKRLNTVVPELIDALSRALDEAEADGEVRAIRLRGAGTSFCAGYDIGWGAEVMADQEKGEPWDPIADLNFMRRYVNTYMRLWNSPKPVIAQVQGFCLGGGSDMALCSDLIVCAEDCRIGYPPARVWGSPTTAMWTYRLGLERSKRMLLTGDPIDGPTAVDWGLASDSVPFDQLDEVGAELAARVARLPANQLQMMKALVNSVYEQMGMSTTQLLGTLLDGSARHTPEGTAFSERVMSDLPGAIADRDELFGDYAYGERTARPT